MIGMDCVNQQARERDCKLTKRSQAERLAIADSLIASVWEEYLNSSIDRDNLQVAAYIQANVNRIVWKLNALNNPNTPNTLEALDCISRKDAVDIINGYAEQFNGYIGTPNDSEVYAYARGLLLSIERNISALTSAQPEHTCVNCGRTANNGGWYADGRTRCPIEEHYALPKDGYCHLWEKRNVTDDDYPEGRADE